MAELMRRGAVPIINENDTVATSEIRYGDNDRLAARVATMVGADLLVLMSDIDGLYTAPPHLDPDARFLETIDAITPEIEAMAGDAGSELSRGGMKTKIDAGKIATGAGCAMIIASGKADHPIAAIDRGARSSWFQPSGTPQSARKVWIAGQLDPGGQADHRRGCRKALRSGKSLLPAGVRQRCRRLPPRRPVAVCDASGREIARGLSVPMTPTRHAASPAASRPISRPSSAMPAAPP
jgi:glutamate 5-kinase